MERIELLAPAGDLERLKVALKYGADAVYFGGQNFSLRANAKNFNIDDIANAVKFAHELKKRGASPCWNILGKLPYSL